MIGKVTDEAVCVGAVPPQVVKGGPDPTVVTPLGKVSTKAVVTVAVLVVVLVNVMVRVELPPEPIVDGLKTLKTPTPAAGGWAAHTIASAVLVSSVTAPVRAKALPSRVAPLFIVMLASARMLPLNAVRVPRVAELPTCQNTLHA